MLVRRCDYITKSGIHSAAVHLSSSKQGTILLLLGGKSAGQHSGYSMWGRDVYCVIPLAYSVSPLLLIRLLSICDKETNSRIMCRVRCGGDWCLWLKCDLWWIFFFLILCRRCIVCLLVAARWSCAVPVQDIVLGDLQWTSVWFTGHSLCWSSYPTLLWLLLRSTVILVVSVCVTICADWQAC